MSFIVEVPAVFTRPTQMASRLGNTTLTGNERINGNFLVNGSLTLDGEWDEFKPTDEYLKELWQTFKPEYEVDQLRNIRNQKLTETDKYTIPDWPQTTEEKETRIKYRQQLRNLPQLYLEKMVGDYSISGEVLYVDDLSYNFFVPIIEEPVAETTETTTEPVTETTTETTEPTEETI